MKGGLLRRHNKGIAGKLHASFGALFALITLIIIAWIFSLYLINQARLTIRDSTAIERTVLDMDRLLEKARRLHGDFFLQYNRIGLTAAHVQFAQPSIRLIAEAITASSNLNKMIKRSNVAASIRDHHVDLNLYLASAKRFADTSIESIELITRLATPERGLEAHFTDLSISLRNETAAFARLQDLYHQFNDFYKEYRISRQRHIMQSAFNVLTHLHQQAASSASLPTSSRTTIDQLIDQLKITGEDILTTDLAIKNKFNDFNIQTNTVKPIAHMLVRQAGIEVQQAQATVTRTLAISMLTLAFFTVIAIISSLLAARFMTKSITGRIKDLTDAATRIQQGQLHIVVADQPNDELGQLGRTFNVMSRQIQQFVNELELKVKRRTIQLAESEQRFRNIANELPNVAIMGFTNNRQIFFWNHTCERIYGLESRKANGHPVESLIAAGQQRAALQHSLQRWIDDDCPCPAGEMVFVNQQGMPVQVFVSYFIVTNVQGEKERYSIHIDLSDLKEAQAESAVRESIYRSLFDHTSSGVGVWETVDDGRDFILKDMNAAAERIEGYTRQEVIGRKLTETFPGISPTGLLSQLRKVWQTGKPMHLAPMLYQYENMPGWRQGHIYKIPTGEVVFVYDDITKLRKAEQERAAMEVKLQRAQKMEAIGLLAGGVAHDLNNILSGIVSYPELILLQLDKDSKLRKSIMAIQSSGQRAAAVVADLLTVARGVTNERRTCCLNTLVGEYLSSPEYHQLQTHHPGVTSTLLPAEDLLPFSCSPVHIKKSLMNLVTNGAEAINRTGRIILRTNNTILGTTKARELDVEPGPYVVLEVADSGSGIAEADIEHIFEPFYTKKVMGRSGTGLGLAVAWNTIRDHKGAVTVTSNNQGTVFTLFFPAVTVMMQGEGETAAAEFERGKGEKILIVDDERQQRDIAGQILKHLGYEVSTVASGEEAVRLLGHNHVDLVLLDMLMGTGLNGRQTFEQIIQHHPDQKALIVSGFSEDEEVQKARRLGVAGYLQKPYSFRNLAKTVCAVLHPER